MATASTNARPVFRAVGDQIEVSLGFDIPPVTFDADVMAYSVYELNAALVAAFGNRLAASKETDPGDIFN